MVLDTFKQTDEPSSNFMAYFCSFAFRKRQESIQFNTHSRAFHRLFSHVCDVTRYSVKPIDSEEEPADDLLAESPQHCERMLISP